MVRGGMPATQLGLPPFTGAVKTLVLANFAVYIAVFLCRLTVPSLAAAIANYGYLQPAMVVHHLALWQLVSYGFLHDPFGVWHILFNMLSLWMFGAQFEGDYGRRRFYEFYFWCIIGAALTTIAVGALGMAAFQMTPIPLFAIMASIWNSATLGASGAIYGLLVAFAMLHGNQQIYVFPLPLAIRARTMAWVWIFISLVGAFGGANGVAEFTHLGGALFGWLYLRFVPRYRRASAPGESWFGWRNRYYRWKRRRAARKFEVYMRQNPGSEHFDEKGNYREPKNDDKNDSGWVN